MCEVVVGLNKTAAVADVWCRDGFSQLVCKSIPASITMLTGLLPTVGYSSCSKASKPMSLGDRESCCYS